MSFDAKRKWRAANAKRKVRRRPAELALRASRKNVQALDPEFGIRSPAGRVTKLTKYVYDSVCRLLAEGHTVELAATLSGVQHATLWSWVRHGQDNPDGPFGQFARDVSYAKEVSHRFLVQKIATDPDWKAAAFLLKNRFPKLYADRYAQELSGPDGSPIPVNMQTFSVVIEMHPQEEGANNNEQEPERQFRVVPVDPSLSQGGTGARQSGAA